MRHRRPQQGPRIRARLARRAGPAGAEGEHEAVQDLISDLRVYRARGGQDLRDPGHRGGEPGLQGGPQRGHPVSGEGVHRTAG